MARSPGRARRGLLGPHDRGRGEPGRRPRASPSAFSKKFVVHPPLPARSVAHSIVPEAASTPCRGRWGSPRASPRGAKARRTTALAMAGGAPTVADSPTPLAPRGWLGRRRDRPPQLPLRGLNRGGDQVVGERAREVLPRSRRRRSSSKSARGQAHGQSTVDLTLDDQGD